MTMMLIRRFSGLNGSWVLSSKVDAKPEIRMTLSGSKPALTKARRAALALWVDSSQLVYSNSSGL